jgi:hypothetical protein
MPFDGVGDDDDVAGGVGSGAGKFPVIEPAVMYTGKKGKNDPLAEEYVVVHVPVVGSPGDVEVT